MLTQRMGRVHNRVPWATLRSWAAYAALPLVGIITAPILARALGPEGRGQLAAILQPLSVADAFAAIGVPAAMTYFVASGVHPSQLRRPAMILLSISTIAVAVGLIAYSPAISRATGLPQYLVLILWGSAIAGAYIAVRRGVWQGLRQYRLLDGERVTAASTRLLLIVLVFFLGVTATFPFAAAYIASGLLASLILFRAFPKRDLFADKPISDVPAPTFAKYSVLASLGAISMTLSNRFDQAALPAAVSVRDLGLYSVAVTVAEVPVIITTVMNRNLLSEAGGNAGRDVLLRTCLTGIAGVTICCGVLAVAAPWLIPFAFGASFASSVPLVWLLLLATVIGAGASALSIVITGRGRPGLGSIGPAAAAAATVALLVVGWQGMTTERAALIAIAAQTLAAVVSALVLTKFNRGKTE